MSNEKKYGDDAVAEVEKVFSGLADYEVQWSYFEQNSIEKTVEDFRTSVLLGEGLKLYSVTELGVEAEAGGRIVCMTGNGKCSEAHARLLTFIINNQTLVRDAIIASIKASVQPLVCRPEIILTGAQILDLHEMCGGEFDDTEWRVYRMEAFTAKADTDGEPDEPMPAGVYAILHEYPDEGFIGPLGVTPPPTPECICGRGDEHVFNPACPHPMHRITDPQEGAL